MSSPAEPAPALPTTEERLAANARVIEELRASGGAVGGRFEGQPLLLLTTTGARTGRTLTSPMVYSTDGDALVVVASQAGAPTHPSWFHNLVASPEAVVEVGTERWTTRAELLTDGDRRRELYERHAAQFPPFVDYQKRTTRVIPVVVLPRPS